MDVRTRHLLARAMVGSGHETGDDAPDLLTCASPSELLPLACRHEITGSLLRALQRSGIEPRDSLRTIEEELRVRHRRLLQRRMRLDASLDAVHRALSKEAVPHVLLKGRGLVTYYPASWERVWGDVDVLVDPGDLERVVRVCASLGFERERKREEPGVSTLYGPDGTSFEIHTALFESHVTAGPTFDAVHSTGSVPSFFESSFGRLPEPALNVLYLMLHGFKHRWCRMKWFLDVFFVTMKEGKDCIPTAHHLAREYGVEREYLTGLAVLLEYSECGGHALCPEVSAACESRLDRASRARARVLASRVGTAEWYYVAKVRNIFLDVSCRPSVPEKVKVLRSVGRRLCARSTVEATD